MKYHTLSFLLIFSTSSFAMRRAACAACASAASLVARGASLPTRSAGAAARRSARSESSDRQAVWAHDDRTPWALGATAAAIAISNKKLQQDGDSSEGLSGSEEPAFKLPSESILTERLEQYDGLKYFLEKTNFIKQLAGQQKTASGVLLTFATALAEYETYLGKSVGTMAARQVDLQKGVIIGEILKDYPDILKQLEEKGQL